MGSELPKSQLVIDTAKIKRPIFAQRPAIPWLLQLQTLANNYAEHFNWQKKGCMIKLNILTYHHLDFEYWRDKL